MPEGHVIHRLAHKLNAGYRRMPLRVTSPQGRFAAEAELLDGERIELAETYGKHLFVHFSAQDPRHILYIHLGLIGKLRLSLIHI